MAEYGAVDVRQVNIPDSRLIYDLVSANNFEEIRVHFNPLTVRHRQSIVCQTVCDTTLLGHACKLGFRDIIKYLLDECEADISEIYTPSRKSASSASSPLRVSIDNLDVSMLLLLISRGAVDVVRRQARSLSTYASNKHYYSLGKMMRHYTNKTDTIDYRSEMADVLYWMTDMHSNANTDRLIRAAACGDIDKMKTLLAGGILKRKYKVFEEHALLAAILNEKPNAEHLLLNYRIFTLKDHVIALEFGGAKLIAFESEFEKGIHCWRKAVRIRTEEYFGESDKFESTVRTGLGTDFSCEELLDILETQDTQLYLQALMVFQRLFPPPYSRVLHTAFMTVARNCVLRKDLLRAIKVLAELFDFPYVPGSEWISPFQKSMNTIENLLQANFRCDLSNVDDYFCKFRSLLDFLNGVDWKVLLQSSKEFYRFVYIHLLKYVLFNVINMRRFHLCKDDEVWIKDGLTSILKCHNDPYPTTLLHIVLDEAAAFPVFPFILGCSDANCTDDQKNTPMHRVTVRATNTHLSYMVNILADAGGHIDAVNRFNISPMLTLTAKGVLRNPLPFLSLQCLAAQTIHVHNLKIPRIYPKILVSFIKLHSS